MERENYFFIHNSFAHFYSGVLGYFADYLYPRFEHRVVGTYDKAVEYIKKTVENSGEVNMPNLPAIILNPSGDFEMAEANAGGHQMWRFPNLGNGAVKFARIFDPIYKDENLLLSPVFCRVAGELEIIMLLNSFYEYCDLKMFMYQIFGGLNRPIFPKDYTSFIIIPDEFLTHTYENIVTGESYQPNWESCGSYQTLVRTTNRNEVVVPFLHHGALTLTNLSDGSTRYGGADKLADWRLTASIRYEIELPWYLVLQSDYLYTNINLNIIANNSYITPKSISEFDSFENTKFSHESYLDPQTHNPSYVLPTENDIIRRQKLTKVDSYYYEVKVEDQLLDRIVIEISEHMDENNVIFIHTKYGELNPLLHYWVVEQTTELVRFEIINNGEYFVENDVIEVYVYEREEHPVV